MTLNKPCLLYEVSSCVRRTDKHAFTFTLKDKDEDQVEEVNSPN